MELRQLTTFRAVAQTLSFTKAADQLNYAQSSVTAQIQQLEEELGVPLFERLGRRVVLTEPGKRLLRYAEHIARLVDEALVAVPGEQEPAGLLTIGAPESLCAYRLPAVLSLYRERYPQVRMVFRPGLCGDLHRLVADGVVDLAFTLDVPGRLPSVVVEDLQTEPLQVLAHTDHPLAGQPSVKTADLKDETLLLTEEGCSYRTKFERVMAQHGVVPKTSLEFTSVEAIKQCTASGMGICVLPAYAVAEAVEDRRLVVLNWEGPPLEATLQVNWHKDKWLSPALAAFLELTRFILTQTSP